MSRSGTSRSRAALLLPLLLAALLVSGCGSGGGDDLSSGAEDRKAAPAKAGTGAQEDAQRDGAQAPGQRGDGDEAGKSPADAADAPQPSPTHVIRTATLRVEAKNLTDAVDRAQQLTADAGGYVGSETTARDKEERERSRMVLRIPPDRYERALEDLADLGGVLERRTSAKDVTDEVVDIGSRIKTQRASVSRVQKLMDRAEKISDIVVLEGELKTRQADLESLLAQQKSLASRTGMATVTLILSEPPVEEKDEGVGAALVDALGSGWHAFYVALRGLLIIIAAVLPFAVALGLVYLLLRRLLPRRSPAPPVAVGPPVPGLHPYPAPAPAPAPASASSPPADGEQTGPAKPRPSERPGGPDTPNGPDESAGSGGSGGPAAKG